LITSICIISALGCFKLQILKRENNIRVGKGLSRTDVVQRDREYLITGMDKYIYSNLNDISSENIKNLLNSYEKQKNYYGSSYIIYITEKDAFYLCFYSNGRFYREELYKYNVAEGKVFYVPVGYSYKEGVLNICIVK